MIYTYGNNQILDTDKVRVRRNNRQYAVYQTSSGDLIKVSHEQEQDTVTVLSAEEAKMILSKKIFRIGKESVNIENCETIAENNTTKVVKTRRGKYYKFNIDAEGYPIDGTFEGLTIEKMERFVDEYFNGDEIKADTETTYEGRFILDEEYHRLLREYAHENGYTRRTAIENIVKERLCIYRKKLNRKNKS